eukprot:RCo053603
MHPATHRGAGHTAGLDLLRGEVLRLDQGLNLLNRLVGDAVALILQKTLQKLPGVGQQLLPLGPVVRDFLAHLTHHGRPDAHHNADTLQHELDPVGGRSVPRHLGDLHDVELRQHLQALLELGQGLGQDGLGLVLDALALRGLCRRRGLLHRCALPRHLGILGIHLDLLHQHVDVLLSLDQHRTAVLEALLKVRHRDLRLVELLQTVDQPQLGLVDLPALLRQQPLKRGQELQVARRGDVVVAPQQVAKLLALLLHRLVHEHAHRDHRLLHPSIPDLDCVEGIVRNGVQGLVGPGAEPVDGAAVDQSGEHSQAAAEDLALGAHAETDVDVEPHKPHKPREHRDLRQG